MYDSVTEVSMPLTIDFEETVLDWNANGEGYDAAEFKKKLDEAVEAKVNNY